MFRLIILLSALFTATVLASENNEMNLSQPEIELVTVIHDFCLEQHLTGNQGDIDNIILSCVNTDLEIASYQTFKSYADLAAFIVKEKGE